MNENYDNNTYNEPYCVKAPAVPHRTGSARRYSAGCEFTELESKSKREEKADVKKCKK